MHLAAPNAVFFLCKYDDGTAFRRFIRERGELRRVREFLFAHAGQRNKFRSLAVAEGDRPCFVKKQRVDVSSRLNRASRHSENIESHETVHPGYSNRGQKRADRRRNEGDEERDENDHADPASCIIRKARNGRNREDKDERQTGKKDIERDFVRRFLPLRTFDKGDHTVEKSRALGGGN